MLKPPDLYQEEKEIGDSPSGQGVKTKEKLKTPSFSVKKTLRNMSCFKPFPSEGCVLITAGVIVKTSLLP